METSSTNCSKYSWYKSRSYLCFFPWWICPWNNPFSTQRLHHTSLSRFSYSISLKKIIKNYTKLPNVFFYIIQLTGCYPFTDRDPFLIESCPHVYFIGNQDKFDTRLIKGIFSYKPFISVIIIAHFLLLKNKWTSYIVMYIYAFWKCRSWRADGKTHCDSKILWDGDCRNGNLLLLQFTL